MKTNKQNSKNRKHSLLAFSNAKKELQKMHLKMFTEGVHESLLKETFLSFNENY